MAFSSKVVTVFMLRLAIFSGLSIVKYTRHYKYNHVSKRTQNQKHKKQHSKG